MTMTRSKNSSFELRICGRSMILGHTIFFLGWSCNGLLTCPICMKDTSCFHLKFGGRFVTLIVIDVFCPYITHLGWTATHSRRIILS
jgi:hypothetical protein